MLRIDQGPDFASLRLEDQIGDRLAVKIGPGCLLQPSVGLSRRHKDGDGDNEVSEVRQKCPSLSYAPPQRKPVAWEDLR